MIKQDCNISFRDATISSTALLEQRKKKKVKARAQSNEPINERQRTEILFKKKCINLRSDKN